MDPPPSPKYTPEFKQKAVELHRKSGTTYAEVARGLECDLGSSSDWAKKVDALRGENLFQMAEDLRRLRHGNERLLRQQAAAGESAKKAKFEPASFNEGAWRVSEMCAALKMTQGLLRMEEAPTERARVAQRGACDDDIPGQSRSERHIQRTEGVPQASPHDSHLTQARIEEGLHRKPGQAQVRGRRPQQGVVR